MQPISYYRNARLVIKCLPGVYVLQVITTRNDIALFMEVPGHTAITTPTNQVMLECNVLDKRIGESLIAALLPSDPIDGVALFLDRRLALRIFLCVLVPLRSIALDHYTGNRVAKVSEVATYGELRVQDGIDLSDTSP